MSPIKLLQVVGCAENGVSGKLVVRINEFLVGCRSVIFTPSIGKLGINQRLFPKPAGNNFKKRNIVNVHSVMFWSMTI